SPAGRAGRGRGEDGGRCVLGRAAELLHRPDEPAGVHFPARIAAVVFFKSRSSAWPGPAVVPARRCGPDPHRAARRAGTAWVPAPGTWTSRGPAGSGSGRAGGTPQPVTAPRPGPPR